MYAGHFAGGLAIWAMRPQTPAWVPLVGVGVLDLLDGAFVAAGIGRVSPLPGDPLGLKLDFVDWDHSLLMAVVWSIAFAAAVWARHDRAAAGIAALAVFSHFVEDVPMHNGDLALYPGSDLHLGLYLWSLLGPRSWLVEGAFVAAMATLAVLVARRPGIEPRQWRRTIVLIAVLHVSFAPALSPMPLAGAHLEGRALALVYAALVIVGFAVPAWLFVRFLPRAKIPGSAQSS